MLKILKRSDKKDISPTELAARKLFANKLSVAGVFIICSFLLVSVLGPYLRPDFTPKANDQHLEIAIKSPGFQVLTLKLKENRTSFNKSFFHKLLFGEESDYKEVPIYNYHIEQDKLVYEKYTGDEPNDGEVVHTHLADIAYAIEPESISVQEGEVLFTTIDNNAIKIPLSDLQSKVENGFIYKKTYLLGTDRYGRDLLSRLMAGTWVSFTVGAISIFISLLIGVTLGALAGYFRGRTDEIIMWLINVIWSIPTLLLVIAITLVLGKGFWQVFVAVGLTMWVEVARVVRGQVLSMREKEFVEAGKSLGFTNRRIIFRHILPNVTGPVIVISAANFAAAILIEAGLSFLGLGAQPPQATWGKMISDHKGYIVTGDAYLAVFPGLAIFLLVLSFVLLGNGLRDAFDTKSVKEVNI